MSARPVGVALSFLIALAIGCSPATIAAVSSSDGGAETGDGSTSNDIVKTCNDYGYAYCTHFQTCSALSLQNHYGTVSMCEALYSSNCVARIGAPSAGANRATIQACIGAVPSWTCNDFVEGLNPPPECDDPPGTLSNGATCAVNSQCQSTFCNLPSGATCGTCKDPPPVGAVCESGSECARTMACVQGACVTYALQSAACSPAQPCAPGYTCAAGICSLGATVAGTTCAFSGAGCSFVNGLACNATTNTCATAALVPPGAGCGIVDNQQNYCTAGDCIRGTCIALANVGGPCDTASPFNQCLNTLRCIVSSDSGTLGSCQGRNGNLCN